MFYIVIGQSGAGKTTFVRQNLIREPFTIEDGGEVAYTIDADGKAVLGRYGIGKRTEGTDTLAYNAKEKIKRQLKELRSQTVVLEGDRINNREIFDFIALLGVEVKLYLITCSLRTSMERLRAAGSTITPTFVKTTKTKSRNMFLEYKDRFHGEVIKTD